MINDNTILSSFNDRPTLLEWLKKVEEALKSDTATGVSVENPSINSYIFKITFADGKTIASDTIRFPDSVKGVSISNNHLIITMQSGVTDDLGVINPYADTIVLNRESNTTEIGNDVSVGGNFKANGTITAGGNVLSAVVANPAEETTGTLSKVKIGNTAYAVGGGTQWYEHSITFKSQSILKLLTIRQDAIKDGGWPIGKHPIIVVDYGGPGEIDPQCSFPLLNKNASTSLQFYYINSSSAKASYTFSEREIATEEITAL